MSLRAYVEWARPLLRGKWFHLTIGSFISIGLTWALLRGMHWSDVGEAFRGFDVGLTLLALVPLLLSMLLRSVRWHVLLKGERATLGQVFLAQSTGIGLNNMLPVRMVSEPVQLAMITVRYRVPFPAALVSLLAGNVMDILATTMLLTAGVMLTPALRDVFGGILLGGVALAAVTLLVLLIAARWLRALPLAKGVRFFQQLVLAMNVQRRKPWRLAFSFLCTVGHWFLLGLTAWLVARGFGMELSPLVLATVIAGTTFFVAAVPSLPGAIGTFQFAMVFILQQVGVDPAAALSLALVMHVLIFLPTTAVALFMLSRVGAGLISRPAQRSKAFRVGLTPAGASVDEVDTRLVRR